MKLYIANCTNQAQDFNYRLPEANSVRRQRIEIGQQIQISGDLAQTDIDAIIAQHAMYGLVRADEVDRTKPFIGLCYNIDKPVTLTKIQSAFSHNQDVLTKLGHEIRKEAAVAASAHIESINEGGQRLTNLVMDIEEDTKDGGGMKESVRVTRRPIEGPPPVPPRGRRAA